MLKLNTKTPNICIAGLFIRAIGESASVLASWGIDRDGRGKAASTRIAEIAGCPTTPYSALLNCVRTIDAQTLTDSYFKYAVIRLFLLVTFRFGLLTNKICSLYRKKT